MSERTKQQAYDAFMSAVLAPQAAEDLMDTDFSRLMRDARRKIWRKAEARCQMYLKMLSFFRAEAHYLHLTEGEPTDQTRDDHIRREKAALTMYRQNLAILLRTPAPDAAALQWKRSQKHLAYVPITDEEFLAAIESDEKFLAAHPVRRSKTVAVPAFSGGADV